MSFVEKTNNAQSAIKANQELSFPTYSCGEALLHTLHKVRAFFASFFSRLFLRGPTCLGCGLNKKVTDLLDGQKIASCKNAAAVSSALTQLRGNQFCGPDVILALKEEDLNQAQLVSIFLTQTGADELPELKDQKRTIMIPLIIQGESIIRKDHIVTVFVNTNKNLIHYYDPKGIGVKERGNVLLRKGGKLHDKLKEIRQKYISGEGAFSENRTVVQRDVHNCGVYNAAEILHRLGKEEIQTTLSAITLRKRLAQYMLEDSSLSKENREKNSFPNASGTLSSEEDGFTVI